MGCGESKLGELRGKIRATRGIHLYVAKRQMSRSVAAGCRVRGIVRLTLAEHRRRRNASVG